MSHLPERTDEISWLLMRTTAEVLDHELEAFREERPDYLITDSIAPWGQWAAEILRVPVVTSVSTFAINRRVLSFALAHGVRPKSAGLFLSKIRHVVKALSLGRQLRRRHRVRGPGMAGLVFGHSDLNIVYTSRHFQPCAESFDETFEFVGPSLADRRDATAFPWEKLRHPVVVYASLGTLFNTNAGFYRNCFEAFRGQDLQVVASTGASISRESLGPTPENFIVQAHVPQLDLLRRAAAFISHGGMNSVSESLYHGVPVVVIPQMGEQEIVGRRVEELGAGLYLAKEEATAANLRASVQRLLSEPRFRQQAAVVRESFETAGGVTRAADTILAFTKRVGPLPAPE
jgi:MGT family glycosyltransferase